MAKTVSKYDLAIRILDKYGLPTLFALLLWWTLDNRLGKIAEEMHISNVSSELQREALKSLWFELRDKNGR